MLAPLTVFACSWKFSFPFVQHGQGTAWHRLIRWYLCVAASLSCRPVNVCHRLNPTTLRLTSGVLWHRWDMTAATCPLLVCAISLIRFSRSFFPYKAARRRANLCHGLARWLKWSIWLSMAYFNNHYQDCNILLYSICTVSLDNFVLWCHCLVPSISNDVQHGHWCHHVECWQSGTTAKWLCFTTSYQILIYLH